MTSERSGTVLVPLPDDRDFDARWILEFLQARLVPSLETLDANGYCRSVVVDGRVAILQFQIRETGGGRRSLEIRTTPALSPAKARQLGIRLFDLEADLTAFRAHVRRDPVLRHAVARRPGLRIPQILDPFEGLVRAILGQQVSVAAARTLVDRLVRRFGMPAGGRQDVSLYSFPAPEILADAGGSRIRRLGLTRARATTLLSAARAVAQGRLDWSVLQTADPASFEAHLTSIPGIGPWTTSYLRMRAFGDRDSFPAGDLGIVRALGLQDARSPRAVVLARAEPWRPWRAYAAIHLWASLSK